MKKNRTVAGAWLASILIVTAVCLMARVAKADGPSKENYADLAGAKENQEVLAENREAHEQFLAAKQNNEERSARLAKDGYRINWSNMTLEPIPFLKPL